MVDAAETRQRKDVLIELFEIGVLDQEELDAEMARLPESDKQALPSPSG